ncbi:MAG: 4Fe-4S dicluster domain-containing protein [Promethearchaeota archaeon]
MNENSNDVEINVNSLDRGFRFELAQRIKGDSLLNCIQCGVCSSGCTVSEWMDLQPHLVVSSLLLGMKDKILKSKAIWTCSLCHRCTERCPKSVDYSFLLTLLRNMAMESGSAPDEYTIDLTNIYNNGYSLPLNPLMKKSVDRRRDKMGLPKLPEADLDGIRKIIEETGLKRFVKGGE